MSKKIVITFVIFFTFTLGTTFAQNVLEQRTFELINIERVKLNVPPLNWHNTLASVARAHSEDMLRNNFLNSTGSDRSTNVERIRRAGITNMTWWNILISGNSNTPEQRVTAWMNSPAHREIIMRSNGSHIGIGVVQRPAGSNASNAIYWTVNVIEYFAPLNASEVRAFELLVFELTNIERAKNGLSSLVWHDGLASVARSHSEDLMVNNIRGHVGSDGSTPSERVARAGIQNMRYRGENCDYNRRTPEEVVKALMSSPDHREAILNRNATHLGVGLIQRPEGSNANWLYYWTQVFGELR